MTRTAAPGTGLLTVDRRLTCACPVPADGVAIAIPPAVTPAEPGDGQARTTEETTARVARGALVPAASATG